MKKLIVFIAVVSLLLPVLVSCNISDPIVGDWREENNALNGYVFNEDGSAHYIFGGQKKNTFNYTTENGQIIVSGQAIYEYEFKDGNLILYSIMNGKVYRDRGGTYVRKG